MLLAGIIATAIVEAVLVGAILRLVDARLPSRGRRMIVNLLDGSAMRGIQTSSRGPWIVLHDAELLSVDGAAVSGAVRIDGTVYIERPRILFVQVLP